MLTNQFILWSSFVASVVMTMVVMFLIFRSFQYRSDPAFSFLLYYAVLIYVFGFYGLWSQSLIEALGLNVDSIIVGKILNILGAPFLIVALCFQILWFKVLYNFKITNGTILYFFTSAFILIVIIFYFVVDGSSYAFSDTYYLIGLVEVSAFIIILLIYETSYFTKASRLLICICLLITGIYFIVNISFFPWRMDTALYNNLYYFFCHSLFIGLVFSQSKFRKFNDLENEKINLHDFTKAHGITPRESEIIAQLLLGKSNLQIADSLFITEQTVKDHVSRIFQKTRFSSRLQLITALKSDPTSLFYVARRN